MPDITMCKGEGCPMRNNCYRYKAEPSMMQTYFLQTPKDGPPYNGVCKYYWGIKEAGDE